MKMGLKNLKKGGFSLGTYFDHIKVHCLVLFCFSLLWGCGPQSGKKKNNQSFTKECVLPTNQQFSLQGKWSQTPIKVSFKVGEWSATETNEIVSAGNTWNTFFSFTKGLSIFNISTSNVSSASQSIPSCGTATISDGTVLYKRASWTKSSSAVAITTTCYNASSGNGLANIFNAIMEFNYVGFFNATTGKYPDIQSIALHEMGHLLGLDHSCGPLGKPNSGKSNVSCPDAGADPDNELVTAVMFPQVFFYPDGSGEQKRVPSSNDQGRANCLY